MFNDASDGTHIFIAFPIDSRFQNGGYDQLWDSALRSPHLGTRKWSGEVDAFILAAGETDDGRRPRLQVVSSDVLHAS